ncbi:hypothetical protein ABZ896_17560 [Streptomyces sp. NPDC047072]|uniref:hypothetical protein n=1 Tax=Streptomyces sp. NPDC047072 TaxID=3154809 RepID=UPI00340CE695
MSTEETTKVRVDDNEDLSLDDLPVTRGDEAYFAVNERAVEGVKLLPLTEGA